MVQNFIANLLRRNKNEEELPYITPIQFDENGNIDPVKSANLELKIKQDSIPLTINDRLYGRDMTQDYQTINPETGQAQMATLANHKPGFFEDFGRGFQENATQGFNVNNLAPVQGKGLATRLGEGLGTLVRFYDKPIGRMAVATGLSMLTDEANPLGEGVKAYVGRQNNMTRDNVYRNQLKQMGMSEDEVNAIPGIITDDIFKNYTLANYRNNMTNYRNLKLDKDTYLKQQQNIYKMLDLGVIDSEEATRQMLLLNEEYNKQNPIKMQEGNKTVQGNKQLDIMKERNDIIRQLGGERNDITRELGGERNDITRELGGERNDISRQNANTYAKKVANDIKKTRPTKKDYVKMQAPNGKIYNVPRSRMRKYINAGGKVVG